jgi:hypothetical protein
MKDALGTPKSLGVFLRARLSFEMVWCVVSIPIEVVGAIDVFRGIPLLVKVFHMAAGNSSVFCSRGTCYSKLRRYSASEIT